MTCPWLVTDEEFLHAGVQAEVKPQSEGTSSEITHLVSAVDRAAMVATWHLTTAFILIKPRRTI